MREGVAVERAAHRVREVEAIHRARHADVGEAALFFEFVHVGQRAVARENAVLEAGQEDDRELEPLGRVHRHERDERRVGIERVEIAHQRDVG